MGKSKMNDKIVNNRVDWSDTKCYCNNIIEHASSLIEIAKKLTNDEYENLQHKEQAQEALKNFVDKFVKEKIPTGLSVINSFANLNHNDIRIEVLFSNLTNVEIHIDINKGELYFKVKENDRK